MGEVLVSIRDKFQSWDDIHELLVYAHKKNIDSGIIMKTTTESSEQLKERVGDGVLFIATIDNQLVGCQMIKILHTSSWYAPQGIIGHIGLGAVHPEHQGEGIYKILNEKTYEYAKVRKCNIVSFDTAEFNYSMLSLCKKIGYRYVDFIATHSKHYSIIVAKSLTKEFPFPKWYCAFRFFIKKTYVILRYKRGAIKRFGI